jgi:hypothetical protein
MPTATSRRSQLILAALDRGVNPDALEKLVALKERMEDRNARKEFAAALAKFRAECPPIYEVEARGRSPAGLDRTDSTTRRSRIALPVMQPHLERNGFTVKWDRTADKSMLTSVCTLRHVGGHSDTSSFTLPVDSAAGMSTAAEVLRGVHVRRSQGVLRGARHRGRERAAAPHSERSIRRRSR